MPPSKQLVLYCLSFLAGVFLLSFNESSWWVFSVPIKTVAGFGIGLCLIGVVGYFYVRLQRAHESPQSRVYKSSMKFVVLAMLVLCFCVGIWRQISARQNSEFTQQLNTKQQWEGVVVQYTDVRLSSQQLTVKLDGFSQNILVITDPDRDIRYGDRLWLVGKLTEAEQFANSDFNYGEYLKMHQVYALMRRPQVAVLHRGEGNLLMSGLFSIKRKVVKRIQQHVPEPQASLLIGILIGAQKTVPEEVVEQFNRTGLSHIVAVSGYNISIIILSLGFLGQWLGRKWGFVISFIIIVGFVVLTGASPSIVRAGIMGTLLLLAGLLGRPYAITPSLVVSAALMVVVNPKILLWDKGFQLSFAATAGIVYVLPYLEIWFDDWPDWLEIKSILLGTFAATWFTWPILVEGFGRLSLVAPLANLLVLPVIPWLMLLGFLGLLPVVGPGFAFVANLILIYITKTLEQLSSWQWASVDVTSSLWLFLACLGLSMSSFIFLRVACFAKRKSGKLNNDKGPHGLANQTDSQYNRFS